MKPMKIWQIPLSGLLMLVALAACWSLYFRDEYQYRERTRERECKYQLRQIGFALSSYQMTYNTFPPSVTKDASGRPMQSWRMLIVPENLELGSDFHLDRCYKANAYDLSKPWNSPGNAKVGAMKVGFYACPSVDPKESNSTSPFAPVPVTNQTRFVAVTGPGTLFPEGKSVSPKRLSAAELAETIVVIESINQKIGWTEPRDLDLAAYAANPDDPKLPLPSSHHREGVNVLMADGRTRSLDADEVRRRLLAMARRAGLRVVGEKSWEKETR